MLVVGWILVAKGLLFLVFAGGVTRQLLAAHPVTFEHMTRGRLGFRRFTAKLRSAGFILAIAGAGMVWLTSG